MTWRRSSWRLAVLGLLPLAIGIGAGAEIQAALARTVIGGLIAATLVTLLLIPVVYITLTRIANRMRARARLRPRPRRARAGTRGDRLTVA